MDVQNTGTVPKEFLTSTPVPCDHCWHTVPASNYSSWGFSGEEVCCHCGTRRNLHGPYAPSPYQGFQIKTVSLDG